MNKITAYKLMRKKKNGSLTSLFINKSAEIPIGKWIWAYEFPTPGFAVRHGWHAVPKPDAPHLAKNEDRVWCKVELGYYRLFERPTHQGETWILGKRMKVLEVIE